MESNSTIESDARFRRIRRVSSFFRGLCLIVIGLLCLNTINLVRYAASEPSEFVPWEERVGLNQPESESGITPSQEASDGRNAVTSSQTNEASSGGVLRSNGEPDQDKRSVRVEQVLSLSFGRLSLFTEISGSPMVTVATGLAGLAFSMVGLGILYYLFGLYRRGLIFTSANVRCYRWIGLWLLTGWLLANLFQLLKLFAAPDGAMVLTFTLDEYFFGGIQVLMVAWIMDEGRALREEQALTI